MGRLTALVEREAELAVVTGAIGAARDGTGSLVVITGAAGAGKTSLLRAVTDTCGDDVLLLRATGSDLEQALPCGGILQVLDALARHKQADEIARVIESSSPAVRRLLDTGSDPGGDDWPSLAHGLIRLFTELQAIRPIVLVLDDAQWLDDLTLQFLNAVAARIEAWRALLVVAQRPDADPHAQSASLRGRLLASAGTHVSVEPITAPGVATMVRAHHPEATDEMVAALHHSTGGNPLLLDVALGVIGAIPPSTGDDLTDPVDLANLVADRSSDAAKATLLQHVGRLSPAARQVLEVLSLVGDHHDAAFVVNVADLPGPEGAAAIEELARGGWLLEADLLTVRHPLVRVVVGRTMGTVASDHYHHRAAVELLNRGASRARVAHHAQASLPRGNEAIAEALLEGASHARATGSPQLSATLCQRALAEPPSPASRSRARDLLALANVLSDAPDALRSIDDALESHASALERAHVCSGFARLLIARNQPAEAVALAQRGLDEAAGDDKLELRLLATRITALRIDPASRGQWISAVREVEAEAARAGALPRSLPLLAELAYAKAIELEDRLEVQELARTVLGDDERVIRALRDGLSFSTALHALNQAGDLAFGLHAVEVALDWARDNGAMLSLAIATTFEGMGAIRTGQLARSLAAAEAGNTFEAYGWKAMLGARTACRVLASMELGDFASAHAALEHAYALVESGELEPDATWTGLLEARGWLSIAERRNDDALDDFREAGQQLLDLGITNPATSAWRTGAAHALFRLGRGDEARELNDEELRMAQTWGSPRPLGLALLTKGTLSTGDESLELIDAGITELARSGDPIGHAWALLARGARLSQLGKRADAREVLRDVIARAERLQASRLAERAGAALRRAGGKPRSAAVSGIPSLTPTELLVANLVAKGKANAEVAADLLVSRKAVEYHLTNIYRKVDVRNRSGLREVFATAAGPDDVSSSS